MVMQLYVAESDALGSTLESLAREWSARTGVVVEIWALPRSPVPSGVGEAVRYTIKTVFAQIEMYGGTRRLSIAVTSRGDGLRLTISHDGEGFPEPAGDRFAVPIARFAALRGKLTVNDVHGAGTTITGAIPL
ncbi:hypothetical protein ACFXJ8_29750 [Nonomuraea sp. NPDC059194]|uniref:hypothetical protein n=1 Tax=Nonomuraea sp. NPDC059194 TaxID=3346764 RepID=UPI0036B53D58